MDLAWTGGLAGVNSFKVQRSTDGVNFTQLGSPLNFDAVGYTDTTASPGTSYTYRVISSGDTGDSLGLASRGTALTIPAAPANASAVASSDTTVGLTWDSSHGATSYTVERKATGDASWTLLSANVASNRYSDTTAHEATGYTYRVTAIDATGGNAATMTATTLPAPATSVTVTAKIANSVALAWVDSSTGATGYRIERTANGGSPVVVATAGTTDRTYVDNTANEATSYTYVVTPFDSAGDGVATQVVVTTPPAAPTSLASVSATTNSIHLTWTDNSAGETGFTVLRSIDGGAHWVVLSGVVPANSGTGAVSFTDTGLSAATPYSYKIFASGSGGTSDSSNVLSTATVPVAVSDLAATTISTSEIDLAWSNVTGNAGYLIRRAVGNGALSDLTTVATNVHSYHDTAAVDGTQYRYEVMATNVGGASAASNGVTATTPTAAPSSLVATPVSAAEVDLTWSNNSAAATGVNIYRATGAGAAALLGATLAANATSFHDTTAAGGTTYTYYVVAVGAANPSANSGSVTVTTVPAAPQGLAAAEAGNGNVQLGWSPVTGAATYHIERSADAGVTWSDLATTYSVADPMAPAYTDASAATGTSYSYRVTARNTTGAAQAPPPQSPRPPRPRRTSPPRPSPTPGLTSPGAPAAARRAIRSTPRPAAATTATTAALPPAGRASRLPGCPVRRSFISASRPTTPAEARRRPRRPPRRFARPRGTWPPRRWPTPA